MEEALGVAFVEELHYFFAACGGREGRFLVHVRCVAFGRGRMQVGGVLPLLSLVWRWGCMGSAKWLAMAMPVGGDYQCRLEFELRG